MHLRSIHVFVEIIGLNHHPYSHEDAVGDKYAQPPKDEGLLVQIHVASITSC